MSKWLYLDPYAEITFSAGKKRCLIFNTVDSKKYIFEGNDYLLVKRLHDNEYSVKLTERDEAVYADFIRIAEEGFFGGIYESESKPLILFPVLKIQKDLRKFNKVSYRDQGYEILENLLELSIHFQKSKTRLNVERVIRLIGEAENSSLKKINLFIESYLGNKVEVDMLIAHLKSGFYKTYIHLPASEYFSFVEAYPDIRTNEVFSLVVMADKANFEEQIVSESNVGFRFTVASEDDYNYFAQKVEGKNMQSSFQVDFRAADSAFLKENVFLNEEDVLALQLTKKSYDANRILNSTLFGKLVIKNGAIYNCEVSAKPIASLKGDASLKQIIFDALCKSNRWFITRDTIKPCRLCLYRNICPPVSENELQLKRYNLCNVN